MNNITSKDNNLFDNSTTSESYQNQYSSSKRVQVRDCAKIAGNLLTILYINKKGYFCDECAHELITQETRKKIQEMSILLNQTSK